MSSTNFFVLSRAITVAVLLATARPAIAQSHSAESSGEAAILFAYYPKGGMQEEFDAGYREHIEWHREHDDPLAWYAWYVVIGDRAGMFIDGTFGNTLSDIDNRIDPPGDRADFARTTAPFADVAFRQIHVLRRDLGTHASLENRETSRMLQVVEVLVRAGREHAFETVLLRARDSLESKLDYAWYELAVGGAHPSYLLVIPRENFASLEDIRSPVHALIEELDAREDGEDYLESLESSILDVTSEMWAYRPDLSYFPE